MKIHAFMRESPDTNNDGTAQKLLIEMCCEYLVKQKVFPNSVIGSVEYFDGQGGDRHKLVDCQAFHKLCSRINQTDKTNSIVMMIASLNRIDVDYNKILWAEATIKASHPNIILIPLTEYGFNTDSAAKILSKYHQELIDTNKYHGRKKSCQIDHCVGADLLMRTKIEEASRCLSNKWRQDKSLPQSVIAVIHTTEHSKYEHAVGIWRRRLLSLMRNGLGN